MNKLIIQKYKFFNHKVWTSPVQKLEKSQKIPGDILMLNNQLYHKTYPGHHGCFQRYLGLKVHPGLPRTSTDFPGIPRTFAIFVEIMSDKAILDHKK